MKNTLILTALALSVGSAATSQTFSEKVQSKLEAQGFELIEKKNRRGLLKFEAVRNGQVRELVYDANTGALIKDELEGEIIAGSSLVSEIIDPDAVTQSAVDQLASEGLSIKEIKLRDGNLKIEGFQDGVEREVIFDAATGEVLSDELGDDFDEDDDDDDREEDDRDEEDDEDDRDEDDRDEGDDEDDRDEDDGDDDDDDDDDDGDDDGDDEDDDNDDDEDDD